MIAYWDKEGNNRLIASTLFQKVVRTYTELSLPRTLSIVLIFAYNINWIWKDKDRGQQVDSKTTPDSSTEIGSRSNQTSHFALLNYLSWKSSTIYEKIKEKEQADLWIIRNSVSFSIQSTKLSTTTTYILNPTKEILWSFLTNWGRTQMRIFCQQNNMRIYSITTVSATSVNKEH